MGEGGQGEGQRESERGIFKIMLSKRIITCLDVRNGKLAKSIKFVNTEDIGDPVAMARQYYLDGVDELVFMILPPRRKTAIL